MRKALPEVVLVDGTLQRADRAHVSVLDRGLLYGDGLFETLRVYEGRVFALPDHLRRLRASARFLGFSVPRIDWGARIAELLEANGLVGDAWVRIVVTRGVGAPSLIPPRGLRPTVIVLAGRLDDHLSAYARRGVRVEILPFANEGPLAGHKVLSYLPALLGKRIARRNRAYEGLYVDSRGRLSEGTTSNLFVVSGHRILTPPAVGLLPGVTRRKVMDLCERLGLTITERVLRVGQLLAADEVFLSSSLAEIVPVVRVGAHAMGTGGPGRITGRLRSAYRQMVRDTLGI